MKKYREKWWQFWREKLDESRLLASSANRQNLSLEEYIKNNLYDRAVSIEVIEPIGRRILERFGIDKLKEFDWGLYGKFFEGIGEIKDVLLNIPIEVENINEVLYAQIIDKIPPSEYSTKMKEYYPERYLGDESISKEIRRKFNEGNLSLTEIIDNWEALKEKDCSFCLANAVSTKNSGITDEMLKNFMANYADIADLIYVLEKDKVFPYYSRDGIIKKLIVEIENRGNDNNSVITQFINNLIKGDEGNIKRNNISNEAYKLILNYMSFEEYLDKVHPFPYTLGTAVKNIPIKELLDSNVNLPLHILIDSGTLYFIAHYGVEKIKNSQIPLDILLVPKVSNFVENVGLDNILEFDKENRGFFSNNNCENLIKFSLNYWVALFEYGKDLRKVDENYYTIYEKDAFDELMRRFFERGAMTGEHLPVVENVDYSLINGSFRERNIDLFLDENAPEELKKLYYSKLLTGEFISQHPEYIEFLKNKKFAYCFEKIYARDSDYNYKNFYQDLQEKLKAEEVLSIISKYGVVLKYFRNKEFNLFGLSEYSVENIENIICQNVKELIIKSEIKDYEKLWETLLKYKPNLSIDSNSPEELKEVFYNGKINISFIMLHPEYHEYLKGENFSSFVSIVNELEEYTYNQIKELGIEYNEDMPEHFKRKYPQLFLPENTPEEIKEKFYKKAFTTSDLENISEFLKYFENTDISYSFPIDLNWLNDLEGNINELNEEKVKIYKEYLKISNPNVTGIFADFMKNNYGKIDDEKLYIVSDALTRLCNSNSSEMRSFVDTIAIQILDLENPIEELNKIEDIFLKNNLPTVGKIFSVFQILHPDCSGFDFSENSKVSPILKDSGKFGKKTVIFADLLKAALGSNNRSIKEYLENIEKGNELFLKINSGELNFDSLEDEEKNVLKIYVEHLNTLYNSTIPREENKTTRELTGDTLNDIKELYNLFIGDGSVADNLPDRIIGMFGHWAGFDTFEQMKRYFDTKKQEADARNRKAATEKIVLAEGDFVKGLGDIKYLKNILQNGSVSKEFLGASAGSDRTPLDTDLSKVLTVGNSISDTLSKTEASGYGPIWIVLKDDDRFSYTRRSPGEKNQEVAEERDVNKIEAFATSVIGAGHYGIRTGFASSEINYFLVDKYDSRIGFEIAKNGFYIPVVDKNGELVFSPNDYDKLRKEMAGLKYFDGPKFEVSKNLVTSKTKQIVSQLNTNEQEVAAKRNVINGVIKEVLEEFGVDVKNSIDGDLSDGTAEFIDTGSTGRGTNMPGDGDFDFMMRLDQKIISDPKKLTEVKNAILQRFSNNAALKVTHEGDYRWKGVKIDNLDTPVDIDISFSEKLDKMEYSTDMALRERISEIKEQSPIEYPYVIANILMAKKVLKQAEVYKPDRGEIKQGGLGGVGVENWILQNGGSFEDAARDFVEKAKDKTFEQFKNTYEIWDFGENHLATKRGDYPHDNFVRNNMNEEGFNKMKVALEGYLKEVETEKKNGQKKEKEDVGEME